LRGAFFLIFRFLLSNSTPEPTSPLPEYEGEVEISSKGSQKEVRVRYFLIFCVLAATSTPAWADTICRQPHQADFGPAVISYPAKAFVITEGCEEPQLAIRRPVSLAIRIGQQGIQEPTAADVARLDDLPPVQVSTQKEPTNISRTESTWTIWFTLDRAELTPSSKATLDTIPSTASVRVTGFTCPLGSEQHNLDLSRRRAENVSAYLQKRGASVVAASGRGECCLISTDNLARNRRAVIQIEKETVQ
jgi:outer membrane protein OmpA-like peptidoglycan-associated protein